MLPTASITAVKGLVCDKYDYGDHVANKHFLRENTAVNCHSPVYEKFIFPYVDAVRARAEAHPVRYSIFMVMVYPVGVPCIYFALLFKSRHLLNPEQHVDKDGKVVEDKVNYSIGDAAPDEARGEDSLVDNVESVVESIEGEVWSEVKAIEDTVERTEKEVEDELRAARAKLTEYYNTYYLRQHTEKLDRASCGVFCSWVLSAFPRRAPRNPYDA